MGNNDEGVKEMIFYSETNKENSQHLCLTANNLLILKMWSRLNMLSLNWP